MDASAIPPCWTFELIGVSMREQEPLGSGVDLVTYFAASSVPAGVAVAFVGLRLTVLASEAGLARAGIASLAGVGA